MPSVSNFSVVAAASQAQQEAATDGSVFSAPSNQQYHPSFLKFGVMFDGTGSIAIQSSYNVAGIVDQGTGQYTVTIATDFSSASWIPFGFTSDDSVAATFIYLQGTRTGGNMAAGSIRVLTAGDNGAAIVAADRTMVSVGGFGDQ